MPETESAINMPMRIPAPHITTRAAIRMKERTSLSATGSEIIAAGWTSLASARGKLLRSRPAGSPRRTLLVWIGAPVPRRDLDTMISYGYNAGGYRLQTYGTGVTMDLLKGTLDVLVLKTLSWGSMHGYAVSKSIRTQTSETFTVEEGALYPALRRLEKRGMVEAKWVVLRVANVQVAKIQ